MSVVFANCGACMKNREPVVSFDKVYLNYGNTPVLKNIAVSLFEKSFYFLTGLSGAGKTTFLKLIYADVPPISGRVTLFGQDVTKVERDDLYQIRQKIGVVFQDFNLLNHLTILENVALPLKVMGEEVDNREKQAKEILEWVGLGHHFNTYPEKLSGGQKQRVAIARAVITRPRILLADEPTGNVDDQIAAKLMNLFYGMHKMGTCVVVATHSRAFIDKFRHTEIHIDNGELVDVKDNSNGD